MNTEEQTKSQAFNGVLEQRLSVTETADAGSDRPVSYCLQHSTQMTYSSSTVVSTLCGVRNGTWVLGSDDYFILGDNRGYSEDSTCFGPVKRGDFVGKTWWRYWPRSRFGLSPYYSCELVSPTVSTSTTSFTTLGEYSS